MGEGKARYRRAKVLSCDCCNVLYVREGKGWEKAVEWCKAHHPSRPVYLLMNDGSRERVA